MTNGPSVHQDNLWRILQSNAEWTRFLDTKAQALLAGAGVLGGFELRLVSAKALEGTSLLHQVTAWASLGLVVLTVLAAIVALTPRTKRQAAASPSHIFYGSIAGSYARDYGSFAAALTGTVADDTTLQNQLANQVWEVSRIASIKSRAVVWGARFLVASMLLAGAAMSIPGLRG